MPSCIREGIWVGVTWNGERGHWIGLLASLQKKVKKKKKETMELKVKIIILKYI